MEWNDFEMLYHIRQGNDDAYQALLDNYRRLLWSIVLKSTKYRNMERIGNEDVMQTAYLTFSNAIERYREDRCVTFCSFLYTCVQHRTASFVRNYFRGNNYFNHSCYSLDSEISSCESITVLDTLENSYPEYCPSWQFRFKEESIAVSDVIRQFGVHSEAVFQMYRDGYKLAEIAKHTDLELRKVEYILRKIKKSMQEYQKGTDYRLTKKRGCDTVS